LEGHGMEGHGMEGHGMEGHDLEEHDLEEHDLEGHGMEGHDVEDQEGDILDAARTGDADAVERLLNRYKPLVRARAHVFHLAGADREDLVQEGMIGLFKAIRDFQPGMGAPFSSFADLCVTRQLMTAVKSAARKKHLPLNSYLSFSQSGVSGEEGGKLPQLRESEAREPERRLIHLEEARHITLVMENGLSQFEKQVIGLYMAGVQYQEIALRTKRTAKAIDNALQRIRRKVGARLRADKGAE
jgi:RNA polymerase sporulation-specific sigma factor